jgi:hypothetical protein
MNNKVITVLYLIQIKSKTLELIETKFDTNILY